MLFRLDEGRINPACLPGASPGQMQLVLLTSVACPYITWSEYPELCSTPQGPSTLSSEAHLCFVANCIDTEIRGGVGIFFPVWEVLVVEVVSFW